MGQGASADPILSVVRRTEYFATNRRDRIMVDLLREAIHSQIGAWSEQSGPKRILDVGCGAQPFRVLLESHGFHYHSFDAVDQGVRLDALGLIDEKLPASLSALGEFDYVLCTEVLEHVLDWRQAFENFRRLLKPGGQLFITCPFVYPLHEEPHDFWRPTAHSIRRFAEMHQFEVVTAQRKGHSADVLALIVGHLYDNIALQAPRNFFHRIKLAFSRRMARAFLKGVLALVQTGWFTDLLASDASLYLSNLALLRKLPQ